MLVTVDTRTKKLVPNGTTGTPRRVIGQIFRMARPFRRSLRTGDYIIVREVMDRQINSFAVWTYARAFMDDNQAGVVFDLRHK